MRHPSDLIDHGSALEVYTSVVNGVAASIMAVQAMKVCEDRLSSDALELVYFLRVRSTQRVNTHFFSPGFFHRCKSHLQRMIERLWRFLTTWCPCPLPSCHFFADVIEANTRFHSWPLAAGKLLIKKYLTNRPIIRLLLLVIYCLGEATMGCPLHACVAFYEISCSTIENIGYRSLVIRHKDEWEIETEDGFQRGRDKM